MKKQLLVLPVLLAFGGCANLASFQATFTRDVTAIETWVASVVGKIQANLPVIEADVQTAIGLACQAVPIAQTDIKSGKAAKYLADASASCSSYAAAQAKPPTGSASVNLLSSIWKAYTAGKAAAKASS